MEYYLKGDYIMIGIFFRAIVVALITALVSIFLIPAFIFGLVNILVCEIISRIVFAKSVIDEEFDWDGVKKILHELLEDAKLYILR